MSHIATPSLSTAAKPEPIRADEYLTPSAEPQNLRNPRYNKSASIWLLGTGLFKLVSLGNLIFVDTDVNGDGKPDVAVSQTGPQSTVQVALGKGDGTFALAGSVNTSTTVGAVVLLDANGDRKDDLAVMDGGNLAVFRSLGNGMFAAPFLLAHSLQAFDSGSSMTAGDVNGDGLADLVPLNGRESRILIYLNRGDGTFSEGNTAVNSDVGSSPALADFNRDGRLDLAMLIKPKQLISSFNGDGMGGFTRSYTAATVTTADSIGNADVNGV